ncbi:MAG: hypothetical protein Q9221_006327 [Calogaya cf. arnoldii]
MNPSHPRITKFNFGPLDEMGGDGVNRVKLLSPKIKNMIVGFVGTTGPRHYFEQNEMRETLRNLRHVREFTDAATRLLFSDLNYRAHMQPAEWSKRQPFAFGHHVKTLFVTIIEYEYGEDDYSWVAAMTECYAVRHDERLGDDHHFKQAFGIYTQLRNDHMEGSEEGDCLAQLACLLTLMPNLEKVVLTGDHRAVDSQEHFHRQHYSHCELLDCEVEDKRDHGALYISPKAGLHALGSKHFLALMSALSTTRAPVKELEVSSRYIGDALDYRVLDFWTSRMHHTEDVFSRLTRLNLDFLADEKDPMDLNNLTNSTALMSNNADTLSQAKNLKHLELHIIQDDQSDQQGDFKTMMLGCDLPNLESCVLQGWNVEAKDLLGFLHRSPKLIDLHLACRFTVGTLDFVLDELRRSKRSLTVETSWDF